MHKIKYCAFPPQNHQPTLNITMRWKTQRGIVRKPWIRASKRPGNQTVKLAVAKPKELKEMPSSKWMSGFNIELPP